MSNNIFSTLGEREIGKYRLRRGAWAHSTPIHRPFSLLMPCTYLEKDLALGQGGGR